MKKYHAMIAPLHPYLNKASIFLNSVGDDNGSETKCFHAKALTLPKAVEEVKTISRIYGGRARICLPACLVHITVRLASNPELHPGAGRSRFQHVPGQLSWSNNGHQVRKHEQLHDALSFDVAATAADAVLLLFQEAGVGCG